MKKHLRLIESTRLTEAKNLKTMPQDEYDSLIDGVLEMINEVNPIDYSHDLEARVAKIKADAADEKKTKELFDDEEAFIKPKKDERKALRAKEQERKRHQRRLNSMSQSKLKDDIFATIADQVRKFEQEEDTWQIPNRRYEDDPTMVVKGQRVEDKLRQDIPTIEVFLDYSGSWSQTDLIKGRDVVSDLQEFVDDGKLILNIFYFTDDIATTPEGARAKGTGTSGWGHIINQVISSGAKNVMIMTDSDMDTWGDHSKKVLVDGCVWFLWKNGIKAPNLPKELKGRIGTLEYNMV
jgi:hypothetical protein